MEPLYLDALDREAVGNVARQTHALWSGGRSFESYLDDTLEQLDRASGLMRFVGLRDGGRIVCSLKRYDCRLATPSGVMRAVGIGALFTATEDRRRGHAGSLLQTVMRDAAAGGCGAALLYSDIDPAYYERLGFVVLPHATWTGRATDLPDAQPLAMELTDHVPTLLSIHEASFAPGWVRPVRNEVGWRLAAWRQRAARTFLLTESGRTLGYVIASQHHDLLWIVDAALVGAPVERLWSSLRRLAESLGAARLAGWLRPDHAQPFTATPRSCCIPMIAPLDSRLADVATMPSHLASFDHF